MLEIKKKKTHIYVYDVNILLFRIRKNVVNRVFIKIYISTFKHFNC